MRLTKPERRRRELALVGAVLCGYSEPSVLEGVPFQDPAAKRLAELSRTVPRESLLEAVQAERLERWCTEARSEWKAASQNPGALERIFQSLRFEPAHEEDPRERLPPGAVSEEVRLRELARLSPCEYDRVRQKEAERLGIRVTTLDREVERRRAEMGLTAAQDEPLPKELKELWNVVPAEDPKPVAELLEELRAVFGQYVRLPQFADVVLPLWVVYTWTFDCFDVSPILAVMSPTKRCGKTRLLTLLRFLVSRPLMASNVSPAAIYRAIEKWHPTLLIDEVDSFLHDNDELRGILNCGHTRWGADVVRIVEVGGGLEPKLFSTWAPKAFAGIGGLPDTLTDRAIEIRLERKAAGERLPRLREKDRLKFAPLRSHLLRAAQDSAPHLREAEPEIPDGLNDRAADSWEPLFAIADLAGGPWPELSREAALALSGEGVREDQDLKIALLADIRQAFEETGLDRLPTQNLLGRLCAMEERPWAEWSRGKPMTPQALAKLLKPFGVEPRKFRDGEQIVRGYLRSDFDNAFERYLPSVSATSATSANSLDFLPNSIRHKNQNVADTKIEKVEQNQARGGCGGYDDDDDVEVF